MSEYGEGETFVRTPKVSRELGVPLTLLYRLIDTEDLPLVRNERGHLVVARTDIDALAARLRPAEEPPQLPGSEV